MWRRSVRSLGISVLSICHEEVRVYSEVIEDCGTAMNRPTPEQIERLQQQDSEIGNPVVSEVKEPEVVEVPQEVEPEPLLIVQKEVNEYEVFEDCVEKVSKEFRDQCFKYLP